MSDAAGVIFIIIVVAIFFGCAKCCKHLCRSRPVPGLLNIDEYKKIEYIKKDIEFKVN